MNEVTRTFRATMPASVDAVEAWHQSPGALQRLLPPWMKADIVEQTGTVNPGDWVRVRVKVSGPAGFDWALEHEALPDGNSHGFSDVQLSGPFEAWRHVHRYEPSGDSASTLEDGLTYTLKAGAIGANVAGGWVYRVLDRMFDTRHIRTWNDLIRHRRANLPPLRIAVTGASGLVGNRLIPFLQGGEHEVLSLVRRKPGSEREIFWDPAKGEIDAASLEGVDAVVHLAGVSIAGGLWTSNRKQAILRSRVDGTSLLARTLANLKQPPSVFVSTSAVGYYGDTGSRTVTEDDSVGEGFLADVCAKWEAAANPASAAGIRVVHPRFGVVMAGEGGMLPLIAKPFKAGIGGKLGNGRQGMAWISLEDLLGVLLVSIADRRLSGPVNAVSPQLITNADFTKAMGDVLKRPTLFTVPAGLMKLLGGDLANEVVLVSQRVVPGKLQEIGFPFAFEDLRTTLRFEFGKPGLAAPTGRLSIPE